MQKDRQGEKEEEMGKAGTNMRKTWEKYMAVSANPKGWF